MRLFSHLCIIWLTCVWWSAGCVEQAWQTGVSPESVGERTETDDAHSGEDAGSRVDPPRWNLPPPADRMTPIVPAAWVTDMHRAPQNIHLGLEQSPDHSIVFTWATTDVDIGSYLPRAWIAPASAVVGEGDGARMPMAGSLVVEGSGVVYVEEMLGRESGEDLYAAWEVSVTGLEPDTEYVYRVGTWDEFDEDGWTFLRPNLSVAKRFRTAPSPGSRKRLDFVLAGDSRGGTAQIAANMETYLGVPARVWFFNGDMTDTGTQLEWDQWLETMRPLMETRPFMPVRGNHEYDEHLFYTQFAMPRHLDLPEELREHSWSLRYGNVHFVGLDSNWSVTAQQMVPWLDADLAAARADPEVDWIVVMSHHPPYSSSMHGSTWWMQTVIVPTLEKHDVDLVFSGHDHSYERTHPIREGAIVDEGEGVVYIVAGAFYSPPYVVKGDWFTAASADGYKANFLQLTVEGNSLKVVAFSGDGTEVLDTFTRTRP